MTEGLQPIGVCTLQLVMFAISEPHLQHQSLTFVGGKFSNHWSYIRFCKINSHPCSFVGLGWGRVNFHHKYGALSQSKSAQIKALKTNIMGGKDNQPHQEPCKQGFPSGTPVSLPAISTEKQHSWNKHDHTPKRQKTEIKEL